MRSEGLGVAFVGADFAAAHRESGDAFPVVEDGAGRHGKAGHGISTAGIFREGGEGGSFEHLDGVEVTRHSRGAGFGDDAIGCAGIA